MQFQFGGHWSALIGTNSSNTAEHIFQNNEKITGIGSKHSVLIDSITIKLNTGTLTILIRLSFRKGCINTQPGETKNW